MTSMSSQERALLQEFLQRLIQIHGIEKDSHADALIAQAVAQQPDAAYLLVQRALLRLNDQRQRAHDKHC